jgi:cation diffusion facilitator CzcD-associated flavoprotein CzcO
MDEQESSIPSLTSILQLVAAFLYSYLLWIVTVAVGLTAHAIFYLIMSIQTFVRQPLRQLRLLAHNPEEDPVIWPKSSSLYEKGTISNPYHVLISGSGLSGLGLAIRLKQEGLQDFIILEREPEIGGTWYANSYPNCACDIPSNLYSFSWEPNPNWSHFYSRQSEIFKYIQHCADKYKVRNHIQLNTEVISANWLEQEKLWQIKSSCGTHYCKYLVNANGPLSDPRIPDFPGKESFKGKMFHSAKWDHNYDLRDKNVIVIGTGASAIQFVPAIVNKAKHVTIFQRTAPYVIPRNDYTVPDFVKKLFKLAPFIQKLQRACIYWFREGQILSMLYRLYIYQVFQFLAKAYIYIMVKDPKLRKIVMPNFDFGCKRILISSDWYHTITRPNVTVIPYSVESFTEDGVIASDGTRVKCDTIILGTGFEIQRLDLHSGMKIYGKDGIELQEFWQKEGAMKAYKGSTIPNFPNFFILLGPNTGLGHNSMIYMIESQLNYIISALRYLQRTNNKTFEVKLGPYIRFNREMQQKLQGSVWNSGGCSSWYLDKYRHNPTIWARGFTFLFYWALKCFDADSYILK